ncbi:MAG: hypothetical protein GC150_13765 [Rhizobiales bacterium]|nr:hypothetical protein [Hyphomicrobiales bacterium]
MSSKTGTVAADVEFEVDLWITDLNPTEIGIYQQARHRAKSRQFTKDMDIFAEVKQGGERSHYIAYRKGLWENNEGMNKRLVIKLFTADMNWRATLDLLLGRSLQLTHGARGLPVTSFSINISDHEQIIQIERSSNKWPGIPENFSFFIIRDDGKPYFYRLKRNWVSVGDDYKLYDEHDKLIGKLNGRVINLGGKWKVRVAAAHADVRLCTVLQLFCGMLKFNDDCRHHLEDLVSGMHRGRVVPKLEHQEVELYMNPRRVR